MAETNSQSVSGISEVLLLPPTVIPRVVNGDEDTEYPIATLQARIMNNYSKFKVISGDTEYICSPIRLMSENEEVVFCLGILKNNGFPDFTKYPFFIMWLANSQDNVIAFRNYGSDYTISIYGIKG